MVHLVHKQDAELRSHCRDLENESRKARLEMENWQDQAERLIDKIDLEDSLLDDLRRQRRSTGDDGFDIDIRQQEDRIRNLQRQVSVAQSNARQWEAQVAIIERQMIANNCDNFA